MTETKTYIGATGEIGGYDGYAGLIIGTRYTATEKDGRMHLTVGDGRPSSVTVEQWERWFKK
jgi:hypothetical protein